jgi:hypothetical protein
MQTQSNIFSAAGAGICSRKRGVGRENFPERGTPAKASCPDSFKILEFAGIRAVLRLARSLLEYRGKPCSTTFAGFRGKAAGKRAGPRSGWNGEPQTGRESTRREVRSERRPARLAQNLHTPPRRGSVLRLARRRLQLARGDQLFAGERGSRSPAGKGKKCSAPGMEPGRHERSSSDGNCDGTQNASNPEPHPAFQGRLPGKMPLRALPL